MKQTNKQTNLHYLLNVCIYFNKRDWIYCDNKLTVFALCFDCYCIIVLYVFFHLERVLIDLFAPSITAFIATSRPSLSMTILK